MAPVRDESQRAVGLIAAHGRRIDREQLSDLLSDRREHRLRRSRLGYQRGYPPQRGLLLGQLNQPRLTGWITVRLVRGTGA
jgi:hypothetical protein